MDRRYILTIDCSADDRDSVETALLLVAERFQGRLTRRRFVPMKNTRYVKATASETLRKLGPG